MPVTIDGTTGITTPSVSGLTSAVSVSGGGTGATSLTANNVILGNGTSAVQLVAPGSSGNVLMSNGTTWASSTPATGALVYIGQESGTFSGGGGQQVFSSGIFSNTYTNYLITFYLSRTGGSGSYEYPYFYPFFDSATDSEFYAMSDTGGSSLITTNQYFGLSGGSTTTAVNKGFIRFNNVRNNPSQASGYCMASMRNTSPSENSFNTINFGTTKNYTTGITSIRLNTANNGLINYYLKIWGEKTS